MCGNYYYNEFLSDFMMSIMIFTALSFQLKESVDDMFTGILGAIQLSRIAI